MSGQVAILFDRFGPYHLARLSAASKRMPVCALELCGESREYQWDPVDGHGLHRVTLFPGRDSGSVGGRECREKLFAHLDSQPPAAVAVPGWATPAALAALEWCGRRRRPAIVMSESTAFDEPRRPWKEWIKRRIVRQAGAGLVGGSPHRDYIRTLGLPAERVFTGYDVVDNAYFASGADHARQQGDALRASLNLPARYFLASNRFIEKKNLPSLLEAYAAYRREKGSGAWSLVLLGDGPLRPQLEQRRTELGLETDVLLPGFRQYGELPAYYALASAFVHASTSEQWGLVVNEAMACSLPVLVSDRCGCAADLVTGGQNGWTFDPHDRDGLTAALARMAALPEPQRAAMGQASHDRIAAWGPEMFAEGLQNALNAARSSPPPGPGLFDRLLLHALTVRQ